MIPIAPPERADSVGLEIERLGAEAFVLSGHLENAAATEARDEMAELERAFRQLVALARMTRPESARAARTICPHLRPRTIPPRAPPVIRKNGDPNGSDR